MKADSQKVLQLGDPGLRRRSREVVDVTSGEFQTQAAELTATLAEFRQTHGFGRAIAAPQIGIAKRLIAVDLGDGPFLVINPVITERSERTFTLWDDCMSFPGLLVRVRRHCAIAIDYLDDDGEPTAWNIDDPATAELLQHEIDHLDGVLAVDRATQVTDIISREAYQEHRPMFDAMVD